MFALFSRYLKDYWKQMLLVLIFVLGQAYTQTSLPDYFNRILKEGIGNSDIDYVWQMGIQMLIMTVSMGILMVLAGRFSAYVTASFTTRIRADLFAKVQTFSDLDYQRFNRETLLTRATSDTTQMQMVVINMLRNALLVPFVAVFTFVRCIFLNAELSLVIAGTFILCAFVVIRRNRKSMPMFASLQAKTDRGSVLMNEKLTGMRTIRAFGMQDYEVEKLSEANKDIRDQAVDAGVYIALLVPLVQVVMNLTIALILFVGTWEMREAIVSLADLLTYIQYSTMLAGGFATVMAIVNALPKCEVSANRIKEVLDYEPEVYSTDEFSRAQETAGSRSISDSAKGQIRFEDVSFGYNGAHDMVLNNINITFPAGKTTAIVGATGSGKTTLLKLLLRFFDTRYYGSVFIDGTDTRDMPVKELRDMISYAPQKTHLFAGTIESNLRVANPDATDEEILKACDMAMVTEFMNRRDEGASKAVTQGGSNLSGGQRQRVSIARAFVKDAPVYLLDDTFSALDFKTDAAVRAAMRKELTGKTIIIVAQRISTIMNADQIVVMDQGRVTACGIHEELLKTSDIYREIYRTQTSDEGEEAQA